MGRPTEDGQAEATIHTVAVAVSGGRDSTALLHCTARQAQALGLRVVALHVHHGLQAQADSWLLHVRLQSQRWGVGFMACRLGSAPATGDSIEAWARRERYAALTEMAQQAGAQIVLLAHHRRDQAETWLLQALRGAGAAGLAAMPRQREKHGITWARPWLDLPRAAIDAYVQRHRLSHIEDGSNADPRHARNRLRLQVWPALQSAFEHAETALVKAATQAQHAAELAREAAELDLPALLEAQGLAIKPWLQVPTARRRNALRSWLASVLGRGVPDALVERLCAELPACSTGSWPALQHTLRLYRGHLSVDGAVHVSVHARAEPESIELPVKPQWIDLSRAGHVQQPGWAGHWQIEAVSAGGASPELLRQLIVRPRSGGEQFQLTFRSSARSLKKQFQARGIPAWQRGGPLLFGLDGQLVCVPGLGLDARCLAPTGSRQLSVVWVPDTTPVSGAGLTDR